MNNLLGGFIRKKNSYVIVVQKFMKEGLLKILIFGREKTIVNIYFVYDIGSVISIKF